MSYPSSPEIPSDEDNGPKPSPWWEKKPESPPKKKKTTTPPKKKIRKATKPFIHRPSRRSEEEINSLLNPSPEELRREEIEEEAWLAAEAKQEEAAKEAAMRSRIRASREDELESWRVHNARVHDEREMALRAEEWKKAALFCRAATTTGGVGRWRLANRHRGRWKGARRRRGANG